MMNVSKMISQALLAILLLAGASMFFVQPAKAVVKVVPGFKTQNGDTWNCDCTGGSGCQCEYNAPNPA
jgi:hypothetical protein